MQENRPEERFLLRVDVFFGGETGYARRDTVEAGEMTPFSLPLEGRETGERSN